MAVLEAPAHITPFREGDVASQLVQATADAHQASIEFFESRGLETGTSLDVRLSGGHDDSPLRVHELWKVPINGYDQRFWRTVPADGQASRLNVFLGYGFTQKVEAGLAWKFHREVAKRMPEATVNSIATDGIGPTATRLALLNPFKLSRELRELWQHDFEFIADRDSDLINALATEENIFGAISMKSIIFNSILRQNVRRQDRFPVSGVIYYDSALVPPEHAVEAFRDKFLPAMRRDSLKHMRQRTPPGQILPKVRDILESVPSVGDVPVLIRQALAFIPGTPVEEIEQVAAAAPMAVINGRDCPLSQELMWLGIRRKIPWVDLEFLDDVGHALPADPYKGADKFVRTARQISAYKPAA